jgi:hypothetical protein
MLTMSMLIALQQLILFSCIVVAKPALFVCYSSSQQFEEETLVLAPTPLVQLRVVVELLVYIKVSICYLRCLPS